MADKHKFIPCVDTNGKCNRKFSKTDGDTLHVTNIDQLVDKMLKSNKINQIFLLLLFSYSKCRYRACLNIIEQAKFHFTNHMRVKNLLNFLTNYFNIVTD